MNYHRLEMLTSDFEAYKKTDIHDGDSSESKRGWNTNKKRERKNSQCLSMMYSPLMFSYIVVLSLFL